uniref:(northern house mosquito) hypothetical protein n=1 Tax=Culex pipiens TaxID=7175 RepID=A0A8D8FTM7_CULPI
MSSRSSKSWRRRFSSRFSFRKRCTMCTTSSGISSGRRTRTSWCTRPSRGLMRTCRWRRIRKFYRMTPCHWLPRTARVAPTTAPPTVKTTKMAKRRNPPPPRPGGRMKRPRSAKRARRPSRTTRPRSGKPRSRSTSRSARKRWAEGIRSEVI